MKNGFTLLVFLTVVVGIGLLIGYSFMPGPWYQELAKPPLTPPNWLFAPVWTLIYVLIAVAGWRAYCRAWTGRAFRIWCAQLVLNFAWSPIVFGAHALGGGFIVVLALLVTIQVFIHDRWTSDPIAAACFVPYGLWVAFASYLNAGLFFLN
ncbi:TspO/MBR family protein [Roseibium sp.]|uniref:TspO/MBR family protein n=1 Tax=Roseibium sp. TaxID=1936156 RepID=UPI003A974EB5